MNDDTDAAGDRRFVRHQIFSAAGDVVAAGGGERIHVNHHRFLRPRFHHPIVNDIRGGDFAARGINAYDHAFDARVIGDAAQEFVEGFGLQSFVSVIFRITADDVALPDDQRNPLFTAQAGGGNGGVEVILLGDFSNFTAVQGGF